MRFQSGFTLIEMLATVAILAIVAAFAAPNYSAFVARSAVQAEANAFALDIRYARSEASRRNSTVLICGTSNGTNCSGNWSHRRIIFLDRGTQGVVDGSDVVMRTSAAPRSSVAVEASGFPTAGRLAIRPTGQPEAAITISFCAPGGSVVVGKVLSVSLAGRPVTSSSDCSDGGGDGA